MPSLPVAEPRKPPRVDHAPLAESFVAAEEALKIAELAGLDLDDWQKYALCRSMGESEGRWSAFEVGLIVPRQNGKTEVLLARCLAGLFTEVDDPELIIFTAHEYKTAREVFGRVRFLLDPPKDVNPLLVADGVLRQRVKTVRTANGEESIELQNGRRLRFIARTSGSGRGFTADLAILDEAHKLTGEQMAAILPTLSARPNPQVWYAAAGPTETSEQQFSVRARGIDEGEGLCYLEWSAPDDVSLDDEDWWDRANPACPHRVSLAHIRGERAALGDEEFSRERLCLHNPATHQSVIPADVWEAVTTESQIDGPLAFAVDVPPERDSASIVAAGFRADGTVHVEVVDKRPGTTWAVDRLAELDKKWDPLHVVVDPSSPAGSLMNDLEAAGLVLLPLSGRELAKACGDFYDAVMDDTLVHHPGPWKAEMAAAVDAGRRRPMGDAWAWHRRDTASDISPLVAATLAAYSLGVEPKKKRKTNRAAFV